MKSAAEDECPVSSMWRIIRKPHYVSYCVMHVRRPTSRVRFANICASGGVGSGQFICPGWRCCVVLDAMMFLALVMVGTELYESANTNSHSVSGPSRFWKRAIIIQCL